MQDDAFLGDAIPDLIQCPVFLGVKGVADEKKGEAIKAVVVLKEEFRGKVAPSKMMDWAKDKVSCCKAPKIV